MPKLVMAKEDITDTYIGFRSRLLALVRRIIKNSGDAEDILQETYIKVFNASKENEIRNPKGLLTHTARNLALNHIDLARNKYDIQLEENSVSSVINSSDSLDAVVGSKERLEYLGKVINRLPDKCRQVFIFKRVYGLSHKEISIKMGISNKTIENHVRRGLSECVEKMKIFDRDPIMDRRTDPDVESE
ncbi:MAG: RNA polymerase sigma factor (sigma-70 family) [Arenicella sp.]|jgi:RNA polymerase sigma-70 factor (ECF subfamily)